MIKKRLLSLILLITMSLGTVVNAQEITGTGYGNVPIEYSQSSTFTVVLPDSIVLDSTKTQEFEVYLSNYDLIDGDKVKVTPTTNTVTMENQIVEIPYEVDVNLKSYQGLEFPFSYYHTDGYFYKFDNYILTRDENSNLFLYCTLYYENKIETSLYFHRYYESGLPRYYVQNKDVKGTRYYNEECTSIDVTRNDAGGLIRFEYNKETNEWVYTPNYGTESSLRLSSSLIQDTETIVQSTYQIMDGSSEFKQYSKTVKDPVDVTITMENEYLTDGTPIKGRVTGSNLSSGNWSGEVVFEISLVK